ncbi:sulfatase-like hydrolase/transferase [Haliea sp. E17]|uniref:sulfatase-like hydrolase/transferase n=1 Tax=Haliea sp. E17 TaxID=3401576 RepID=UPI003AAEFECE
MRPSLGRHLLLGLLLVPSLLVNASDRVGRTVQETHEPRWPAAIKAPAGAPNVLVIMTDDVGFGATSAFGGPVPTPTFDELAEQGLRYNRFNTTALCSPTRASLLTGRYPHNVNMGNVTNLATGYDGYTTVIPKSAGTLAEILKQSGYNTAMFGKGHLTPEWEMSMAGPYDRWPTGLGFEYFYGFLSADTSMWNPGLVENTRPVEAPTDQPGYHFDRDMADKAIAWIQEQQAVAPDKPFFIYYAPGTAHTPHHAPREWLEKFRGKFDQGWDATREQTYERQKAIGVIPADAGLSPRVDELPAWSSLSKDQRRLYARLMEAYAASLAYTDFQAGRVIDAIRQTGEFDNTLVIYIQGDNGASAEGGMNGLLYEQSTITGRSEDFSELLDNIDEIGGPNAYNHIPAAWAWALNSPFPWWKQVASQAGGVRNGVVVSWPGVIGDRGGMRGQYAHVSDVMPTVLEAAGVKVPETLNGVEQQKVDGVSLLYSFNHPDATSRRNMQVYEMMENFGIYHDGWIAGTLPKRAAWEAGAAGERRLDVGVDERKWSLFNLDEDFSSAVDLAESEPVKLAEMQKLFWVEAGKNNILPIHDYSQGSEGRPSMGAGRSSFEYPAGISRINEDAAPHTIGRSFTIDADIVLPESTAHGVIITQGGRFGGYALYLDDGRPVFHYNAVGLDQYSIRAKQRLVAGRQRLTATFVADDATPGTPGTLTLSLDGREIASGRIERTVAGWMSHTEGLDIGRDTITPVNDDYSIAGSVFTGSIDKVTVRVLTLSGEAP